MKFVDIIPFMQNVLSTKTSETSPLHCDVVRNQVATLMGVDPSSLGLTASKPQKPVWSMLCGHAFNDLKAKGLVNSKFKGQGGAEWWWIGASAVATPSIEQPIAVIPMVIAEQPIEQPIEQPQVEQPMIEQPQVEQPQVEKLMVEQPQVEQPKVEQPKVEQPQVEQPKVEQPQVEQPKVVKVEQPIESALDTLKARALAEYPSFKGYYDYTDSLIKALAIKSTPCFASFSAKDKECLICPLASDCQAKKLLDDKAKAELKAYKQDNKEQIEHDKLKATYLSKLPTSAVLSESKYVPQALKSATCGITLESIEKGQPCFFVKGAGLVSFKVGEILGLTGVSLDILK